MIVRAGSTSVTTYFVLRTASDGTATTGATPADFDLQYTRSGAAAAGKVDATLNGNGVGGAWDDNTVIEVDAASSPGLYRIDWPNAAFAAGAREVILTVKLASSFTEHLRVELSGVDVTAVNGDTSSAAALEAILNGSGIANDVDIQMRSLTITNDTGNAVSISSSGSNGVGIAVSGNGSGDGMIVTAGITGDGLHLVGGATSGSGLYTTGPTLGHGIEALGVGSSMDGIEAQGYNGMTVQSTSTNGIGFSALGAGTGVGILGRCDAGTGIQGYAEDGGTRGIWARNLNGVGFEVSCNDTAMLISGQEQGLNIVASAGPGIEIDGTEFGIECDASDGPGVHIGGTTFGMQLAASNGPALSAVSSGGNGDGIIATANGSGKDFNVSTLGWLSDAAIGNFEDQFDGTGYIHDTAPATQLQLAGLSGGLAIAQMAETSIVTQGAETNDHEATWVHDGVIYDVTDSESGVGIDFYLQFDLGAITATPVSFHMHGWFQDPAADSGVSIAIQAYNFNVDPTGANAAGWETIETLEDGSAEEDHSPMLTINNIGDPTGSDPGIVRIRFVASASAAANVMHINHAVVNYVNSLRTDVDGYVLLSDGTGTGQIDLTSGVVLAFADDGENLKRRKDSDR